MKKTIFILLICLLFIAQCGGGSDSGSSSGSGQKTQEEGSGSVSQEGGSTDTGSTSSGGVTYVPDTPCKKGECEDDNGIQ